MRILKQSFLHFFCLVIITTCNIACDDKNKDGKNGNPAEAQNAKNGYELADDLKGFQLIRKSTDGASQEPQVIDDVYLTGDMPFAESHESLLTSDQIFIKQNPNNTSLTFHASVECSEQRGSGVNSDIVFEKDTAMDFSSPLEFITLLPREALFMPGNPSGDTITCEFEGVHVKDESGFIMAAFTETRSVNHKHDKVSKKVLAPESGHHRLLLSLKGIDDLNTLGFPELSLEQIQNELIVRTDDDSEFDKLEIECSNFKMEQATPGRLKASFLHHMDLRLSESKSHTRWDYFTSQDCRIFSYLNGQITGFSNYFKAVQDNLAPQVDFSYAKQKHYGEGFGPEDVVFVDTDLAVYTVSNPHASPVGVSMNLGDFSGKAQFVSITNPIQLGPEPYPPRYLRSVIKTITPDVSVRKLKANGTSIFVGDVGQDGAQYDFILKPGEKREITLSFRADNCWELWHPMRKQGRDAIGMQGTVGALVTAEAPEIKYFMVKADESGRPIVASSEGGVTLPGRAAGTRANLIFSTSDNRNGWQQKLIWPADQYTLGLPVTANSGPYNVCPANHTYLK